MLAFGITMHAEPVPSAGTARSLLALRHALADPLSSASLKLDLVERRLAATDPDVPALLERVRAVKHDLSAAGHILDLLLRLAEILAEPPQAIALSELCAQAGVRPAAESLPSTVLLRRKATAEAVRHVAGFLAARTRAAAAPLARTSVRDGCVTLTLEAAAGMEPTGEEFIPARLLSLPPGLEGAEGLYTARAVLEADGGRFDLDLRDERLIAEFSWTAPTEGT
ncbi:MAG: hypothetical protein ABIT01_13665 [Thermoanaerobaculia bacterium]